MPSQQECRQLLLEKVEQLACPECEEHYTEFALHWGEAYVQGRLDAMDELGREERNDTMKIKCELCGTVVLLNLLAGRVERL